ncbi:CAP domain-containing protein [Streptomyces sp. NPDC020807]|uniref:CAP domain-containing protein n=1 Tax=Streptomyces sp. NPDC020807 TaxID=3155119 RepID=UPI0033C81541
MRHHHDHPRHPEEPGPGPGLVPAAGPGPVPAAGPGPAPATSSVRRRGRHRRRLGARRRPGFRAAVASVGAACVLLTVAAGVYAAGSGADRAGATSRTAASRTAASGTAADFVREVVALANEERERAGCGPLRAEAHLRNAAQGHADDMARRDYYRHDSPEGRDAGDRITGAGYTWSRWGENIHRGPDTPARAMADWMDSPSHRENILDCSFKDVGVGVTLTANGPWWVQNFGAKR